MIPTPLLIVVAIIGTIVFVIIAESVYKITKNIIRMKTSNKPPLSTTVDDLHIEL